jgi:nucleoside-diphosphate-sugar epimerase
MAREKGVSAYVGDGANRWAAAPLRDAAHLYRLAVEQTRPGVTVYHAVQEVGVALREIAETLGAEEHEILIRKLMVSLGLTSLPRLG